MTYDIVFTEVSLKQLKKLDRQTQERIIAALERIRIRPQDHVKKLVGDPGYRLRVGDYRVLMEIDQGVLTILVLKIGHRKNIYER